MLKWGTPQPSAASTSKRKQKISIAFLKIYVLGLEPAGREEELEATHRKRRRENV